MDEEEKEKHEYRLSIQFNPWQAVLKPLQTSPQVTTEKFSSPLELLERLERPPQPHRGVK